MDSNSVGDPAPRTDEFNLDIVYRAVSRRWKLIAAVGLLALLAGAAWALFAPRTYSAQVTALPRSGPELGGLLGALDLQVGSQIAEQPISEALYGEILRSDRLLDALAKRAWENRAGDQKKTLFELFDIESEQNDPSEDPEAKASLKVYLRQHVLRLTRNRGTGFMQFSATVVEDPVLAATLANESVALVDAINQEIRGRRLKKVREFAGKQAQTARAALDSLESELALFVRANRAYDEVPELRYEYNKKNRDVAAQTRVWSELKAQFEFARIEEQKQLPTMDILDRADVPVLHASPRLTESLVVALLLAFVACAAFLLVEAVYERHAVSRMHSSGTAHPSVDDRGG